MVRRLKKVFPAMRIIILSIHDEQMAVSECLEAGSSGFVLKRTAVNDLVPAVEAVRKGDVYVSPAVRKTHNSIREDSQ